MAGIGKLTVLVFLSIMLLTSNMSQISSTRVQPSNIPNANNSTRVADNKDKIIAQQKGTQVPHWHIVRGIKLSYDRSDLKSAKGAGAGGSGGGGSGSDYGAGYGHGPRNESGYGSGAVYGPGYESEHGSRSKPGNESRSEPGYGSGYGYGNRYGD